MRTKRQYRVTLLLALLSSLLGTKVVIAQRTPSVDWWVIAGGGGPIGGDGIALNGTLGQPIIGPSAVPPGQHGDLALPNRTAADSISLGAGYWYGVAAAEYAIYLPVVTRGWWAGFPGPWEVEDNDTFAQANGPLFAGRTYCAYPDDMNDIFFFCTDGGGVTVELWDYAPAYYGSLYLYDEQPLPVARDPDLGDGGYISVTLAPGRYYIRVFTAAGYTNTQAYQLRVTFP